MTDDCRIGIDLGGTNCRGALVDARGNILQSLSRPTHGPEGVFERLVLMIQSLLQSARKQGLKVEGIGVGAPGVISRDGEVSISPNLACLNGMPLARRIEEAVGMKCCVLNDANAMAWGEALFGAGRELSSFVTLTLGTGVGGGLVLERRLWAGADGAAGEIGHLVVEPGGRPCGCGSFGCLEQYASATGILASVRERLAAGQSSSLADFDPLVLSTAQVMRAAEAGDALAIEAFAEAGRRLGQVLAGVANLLNLDGVVLCGGVCGALGLILPSLKHEIEKHAFPIPARRMQILSGTLGDSGGVLGAAYFAGDSEFLNLASERKHGT